MNSYFEKMLCQIIEGKNDLDIDFDQYPKELYRYRPCNEYNFDSLENDYLWMSRPSDYKDPFDAFVPVDKVDIANIFEEILVDHIAELFCYFILPQNIEVFYPDTAVDEIEDLYHNLISYSSGKYDQCQTLKNFESYYYNLPIEQQEFIKESLKMLFLPENFNKVQKAFDDFIIQTANSARDNYMSCSLTKRNDNRNMWENYAENYSGFVIEYTLDKNNLYAPFIRYLFEVDYTDTMFPLDLRCLLSASYDATFNNKAINIVDVMLPLAKMALIKNSDYKSEEEWRFITRVLSDNRVQFPFATAVYVGYKIADEHLDKLQEICQKKSIPLYKQEIDILSGKLVYNLKSI